MTQRTQPTYSQYTRILYGKTQNEPETIKRMLQKSFSAPSFPTFWRYWNPIFSYNLYYRIYKPLSRFLPRPIVLILTFAVSGAIHDLAVSLLSLREGNGIYFLFTIIFATWGVFVVIEEALKINFRWAPIWLRVIFHLIHIVGIYYLVRFVWFNLLGFNA